MASKPSSKQKAGVRGYSRALKNAHFLQSIAPDIFAKNPSAAGFGTGIPLDILSRLHRTHPESPVLRELPQVANFLKTHQLPLPERATRSALFSGTVYFAQVTFQTTGGNLVTPAADMNTVVQYAQHAIVPISEYAAQYGPNKVSVSSTIITYTANVPSGTFSDSDLQSWINDMANVNSLTPDSCIYVVCPSGISASDVGDNAGYHSKANIPYVVAGVYHPNLTLSDIPDVYAMVVSHEMAEMVVDPNGDNSNPEVCDPCDINCGNLTRVYFDSSDDFLGVNQSSPPGGFTFSYYICAIVKPGGAANSPASSLDCQYAPITQYCQLIIDKSTFGKDDVDLNSTFNPVLWLQLVGFTEKELGMVSQAALNQSPNPLPVITASLDNSLNPSLTAAQLSTIAGNLPSVTFGPLPISPPIRRCCRIHRSFCIPMAFFLRGMGLLTP